VSGIATREAIETDVPFVIDSWARHFYAADGAGVLPRDIFLRTHRAFFAETIARNDVHALVAYEPTANVGEEIYGYLVHETGIETPILHYAYVTDGLRRRGVLKALLSVAGIDPTRRFFVTCRHPRLLAIRDEQEKLGRTLPFRFDPRLLRSPTFKGRYDKARRRNVSHSNPTTVWRRARRPPDPCPT
jgi:hypothetical protein